ncbi:hypothetical protein EDB81DRAFT_674606 [Dactylonectria macrodidyma]|uniref:Uncharacterized protein n=1 Tax=Dactylonectria macrodidyma TaxID=307937 RepID=A0A9P9FTQ4_9HYPO|nr:hypothetical protein EDB81DRAFT_674606 [Dactylonectria macrodidyma]
MDTLRYYLGLEAASRRQPPKVETDDVYQVHFLDDLPSYRAMVLSWTLRFNDVLDAEKLHNALVKLLEIGDWRKLGGRVRARPDGKLEIHVPKEFTPERPAVRYTRDVFNISIGEHPLASQLPRAAETPSLHPGAFHFRSFGASADAPTTLKEFLCSDEPQLALHITSFSDATLVGLLFPHIMTGALGQRDLVAAWSKVLAGREDEVPPLEGTREDVLNGAGTDADNDQELSVLATKELKGFALLKFTLRFMWDVFRHPSIESGMICLPPTFVSKLRQTALGDLRAQIGGPKAAFVSEGDVLTAWATRFIAKTRGGLRPATIYNAVDIRRRVKAAWVPGAAYVQNLTLSSYTMMSVADFLHMPLGMLAYMIREDLQRQATDAQLRTSMRRLRAGGRKYQGPLYGEPDSLLVIFSNWTKANLYEVIDFAPAVIESSSVGGQEMPRGKAVYMHSQPMVPSAWTRNVFNIVGKDLSGNYWITALLLPGDWQKLEEEIAKMS